MEIRIQTLRGKLIVVSLAHVGAVYPEDDTIYFSNEICKLSTARPISTGQDEFLDAVRAFRRAMVTVRGSRSPFMQEALKRLDEAIARFVGEKEQT